MWTAHFPYAPTTKSLVEQEKLSAPRAIDVANAQMAEVAPDHPQSLPSKVLTLRMAPVEAAHEKRTKTRCASCHGRRQDHKTPKLK